MVEKVSSTNAKYRITWQGTLAPNILPGKTNTLSAKVSLTGVGLGGNETCDAAIEMPSCSIKNLKRQLVLTCK